MRFIKFRCDNKKNIYIALSNILEFLETGDKSLTVITKAPFEHITFTFATLEEREAKIEEIINGE